MVPLFICESCKYYLGENYINKDKNIVRGVVCSAGFGGEIELIGNLFYTSVSSFEHCPGLNSFLDFLDTTYINEKIIKYENSKIVKMLEEKILNLLEDKGLLSQTTEKGDK